MIYLILAFVCSALISTLMRVGEKKIQNNMTMFMANYLVCALLALFYKGNFSFHTQEEGIWFSVTLGVAAGFLFLANFILLQFNIRKNGIVLSGTFMKLGLLVPIIMAVTVFRERPQLFQILGCVVAIAAIIIVQFDKTALGEGKHKIWLVIMLLVSGFTDSLSNIYEKLGNPNLKEDYLLFVFLVAFLFAAIEKVMKHQKITGNDLLYGCLIGIPNYFSARFLLLSLSELPAVLVYPVYSVATIVLLTVIGIVIFKEKMTAKKWIALVMILVALAMMNM
ncbi:MAG: SMR family transporter [Eubacteriales bacterium]|nr:SMR family transporter [Eubacteriales bacterium]